jgi:hypothetical protein
LAAALAAALAAIGEGLHATPHLLLLRHAAAHHGPSLVSVTETVVSAVRKNCHVSQISLGK